MRLFASMLYGSSSETSRDYLAEVVRKTPLANRLTGMAIKILTELGHSTAPTAPRLPLASGS